MQRPPQEIVQAIKATAQEQENMLARHAKAEEERARQEMNWLQWEIRSLQNRMSSLSNLFANGVRRSSASTDELPVSEPATLHELPVSEPVTPGNHFQITPEQKQTLLTMKEARDSRDSFCDAPTTILNPPVLITEYVIKDELTFDTIIASLGYALNEHMQSKKAPATTIHMSAFLVGLLEVKEGMTGYPTAKGSIPIVGDRTIPNDTIRVKTLIL